MTVKRCDSCKGRKTLLSLGNMIRDCHHCKGIGWIEFPVAESELEFSEINIPDPIIKKKRKYKIKNTEDILKC